MDYKKEVIQTAIDSMSDLYPEAKAFESLFYRIYECGYYEAIRQIQNKQVSEYSDRYSDIISDGGPDPR